MRDAAEPGGRGELIDAIAHEVVSDTRQRTNPRYDFKPKGALAGPEIVEELADVHRIVSSATPDAVRVSEGEQRMLGKLAEVLAPPA